MTKNMIKVVTLGKAHGIRGDMRMSVFLEDIDLLPDLMPLYDEKGQAYVIKRIKAQGNGFVGNIEGANDRTKAESLVNKELFTSKDKLPEIDEEDEFYYADLEGLSVLEASSGEHIGEVLRVVNFGAGDLLEIRYLDSRSSEYIPLTEQFVPEININEGFVQVNKPILSE